MPRPRRLAPRPARRPRRPSRARRGWPGRFGSGLVLGAALGALFVWGLRPEPPPLEEVPAALRPPCLVVTSTVPGPCRAEPQAGPKIPRRPVRRRPPAVPEPDLPAAVGEALRRVAETELQACAPPSGTKLHAHLEIHVAPSGRVVRVRTVNVGRTVPPEIQTCLSTRLEKAELPRFDGVEPARFSLSVVL